MIKNKTRWFEGILYEEQWKPITGYEGRYEISSFGRVKSLPKAKGNKYYKCVSFNKDRILSERKISKGYIGVILYNKVGKNFKVHRLVATHFIPNCLLLPEVHHVNEVKKDNFIKNLEWVTGEKNLQLSFASGNRKVSKGEKSGMAKLKKSQVLYIIKSTLSGVILSNKFNVTPSCISSIRTGASWRWLTNV